MTARTRKLYEPWQAQVERNRKERHDQGKRNVTCAGCRRIIRGWQVAGLNRHGYLCTPCWQEEHDASQ